MVLLAASQGKSVNHVQMRSIIFKMVRILLYFLVYNNSVHLCLHCISPSCLVCLCQAVQSLSPNTNVSG